MSRQTVPKSPANPDLKEIQAAMRRRLRMPGTSRPPLDELLELNQQWLRTGGIQ